MIESLERRVLFTVYVVDTLADAVAANGQLSLREAITAANTNAVSGDAAAGSVNGDRITFAAGIANGTITLNGTALTITDDLVIDGETNNITIDADGDSGVVVVNTAEIVGIARIALTGGINASLGGGGVRLAAGTLNLGNVEIANNQAWHPGAADGGGIWAGPGTTLTVANSVIEENYAQRSGGGIYAEGATVTITNSQIQLNATIGRVGGGGGIAAIGGSDLDIASSVISQNSVIAPQGGDVNGGGGIMLLDSTADINSSDVNDNGSYGVDGSGGGVEVSNGTLGVIATDILRNSSGDRGGGIAVIQGTLSVQGSLIEQNASRTEGGGAYVDTTGNSIFSNTTIRGNSANNGSGGGIFMGGQQVRIENCSITLNFANSGLSGGGGGIWHSGDAFQGPDPVVNTLIAQNRTSGRGGGIVSTGSIAISGSTIHSNWAQERGGGVENSGVNSSILNTAIYENLSNNFGGGIANHGTLSVQNIDVFLNIGLFGVGGIYSVESDLVHLLGFQSRYAHDNIPNDVGGF